jgi:anhydro-N-acetylmuramic acid kinase
LSYYIGLLSGTSVDGIDTAIVQITNDEITLIATHQQPFSPELKHQVQNLIKTQQTSLSNYANCDVLLAEEFSHAVKALLSKSNIAARDIIAIGSHGQTIYHQPNKDNKDKRSTIQIGSTHIIAAQTGIDVVANFRSMDMALNGQGAPLAPVLHEKLYQNNKQNTAVINLGGIANVSFFGKDFTQVIGYDIGPANCLLDEWVSIHQDKSYDENGQWAQQGVLNEELLNEMLLDEYFQKSAPKSTGREYFNSQWLGNVIKKVKANSAADIQNTLTHLTAQSIALEIKKRGTTIDEIILMGGGAFNTYLVELIKKYTQTQITVAKDANWIEAILFAYLAERRIKNKRLDLSSITGSDAPLLLGDIIKK